MEEEKKITKIVIGKEDELTDLVTAILESTNERVVLTFAEETDLLISPINLKVLLETADEREKLLVAQIIKNPTGIKNASLAGLSTIDSPSFPTEDIWEKEETSRVKRLSPPKKVIPNKETLIEEETQVSDFQKKVDDAIEKSRNKEQKPEIEEDDILISLDEDLPVKGDEESKNAFEENFIKDEEKPDLSTVDFNKKIETPITEAPKKKEKSAFALFFIGLWAKIKAFFKKIPIPKKLKRLAPLIILSVVLITILVGIVYINTAIVVRVRIYVEAKEVEIERIFQGDENIKEIDFENLRIPVKVESVEKSRSTTVMATGTAFRGEKATGAVIVVSPGGDSCDAPIELSSGQILSTEGKNFSLDSNVTVPCGGLADAKITAIEVGEEYNLAQGKRFLFQNYSSDVLFALNSNEATKGGSKEEYTILSKADVDTAVADLKKIATEEGENELREKNSSWEIISDSIVSIIVPDSTKTDVGVGAEATQVNVSIQTKSTATYFLKEGFDEAIEKLLADEAKEKNLFETDTNWELELDKDIEKEISVLENSEQGIRIQLVARSAVKPKVDKNQIAEELGDMKWEEGIEYLKNLNFANKEPRVEFLPENFPKGLRYFPDRRGGIIVEVENVK